jgi:hypothetical protein
MTRPGIGLGRARAGASSTGAFSYAGLVNITPNWHDRKSDPRFRMMETRMKNVLVTVFVVGAYSIFAFPAKAATECSMSATLASWGEKSTGFISIAPKESCQFPLKLPGTIASSEISQKPGRGKLKKIDTSTYQYSAKARFKGTDSFAITATGRDEKTSGTSTISVEVTIK